MALIDKETIRAEIERRKKELPEQDTYTTVGADSIRMTARYDDLLAFLDSLPEQVNGPSRDQVGTKFAVERLEDEIENYYGYIPDDKDKIESARHFAEWQKKQDDLETADLLAIAHLQGMEQQKSKMLEDAVEGEIQMRYSGCLCAKTIRAINEDKFKLGDKVRVIVIKEKK